MTLPKVVVTNWVHPEVVAALEPRCRVSANPGREPWPADTLRRDAADADALMTFMSDSIDEAFLAACPRLRMIACALKGFDNFDVEACTRRGVQVTIVPDLLTAPTAELAVGLMIALARRVREADRYVRDGRFQGWRPLFYGTGLDGSTVGILGMGAVGRAIAQRLGGFGCTLLYQDERPLPAEEERRLQARRATPEEIAMQSDYLLVGLPLTAATVHAVDTGLLARVKPGALLVNISRGSVVDEEAVAGALDAGRLGDYAADVFEMEDWARRDRPPGIAPRLLAEDARTVLTPHLGSAVDRVRHDIALAAANSILQFLAGRVPDGAINDPAR